MFSLADINKYIAKALSKRAKYDALSSEEKERLKKLKEEERKQKEKSRKEKYANMGAIEGALRASPATGAILYALDQLDSDIYEQTERTVFGATADIGEEIVALGNTLNDKLGIYEFDDELNDKQQEYNKQILSVLFGPDSVEMDSRGNRTVAKVKEPTYYGGETARDLTQLAIGLRFGTKAATTGGNLLLKTNAGKKVVESIDKSKKFSVPFTSGKKTFQPLKTAQKVTQGALGAEVGIATIGVNPYDERLANFVGTMIGDDDQTLNDVIDFLKADDEKSELEARMGLLGEGLMFSLGLPYMYYGGKFTTQMLGGAVDKAKANKEFVKTLKDLKTRMQKGSVDPEAFIGKLKQSAKKGIRRTELKSVPDEVIKENWGQYSTNTFFRQINKYLQPFNVFNSAGFMSKNLFKLFNQKEAAKKAWSDSTENVARRIDANITRLAGKSGDTAKLQNKIYVALTEGDDAYIDTLPKYLQQDLKDMRLLIDDFSEMLLQQPNYIIDKATKKTIKNNIGQWLRRSYRLFEDPSYKVNPGDKIYDDAVEYFRKEISQLSKYKIDKKPVRMSQAEWENKIMGEARARVEDILGSAKASDTYFARMQNMIGSNRNLLKRRGDLDPAIRKLMGEIDDPSVNILNSINRISSFVEDLNFLKEARKIGLDKYFYRSRDTLHRNQLKGKEFGALKGLYVNDELFSVLKQKQAFTGIANNSIYKGFLAMKGYSQAAKTVLNHITHLRNTIGGALFTAANGNNPFGKGGTKAIKTIYQKRFAKVPEQEALDYYNRLVSLDIVNTSVRFGDIQNLIKETSDTGVGKFLDGVADRSGLKKYAKAAQDLYIAEDDLFKIISFEQEFDTLLKAAKADGRKLAQADILDLERQAADIVRNTIPTYSLVPRGIQSLRKFPIGSYFSFPAEMTRTSFNTVKQGLKEMSSSSTVIKARGARRLGGFLTVGALGADGINKLTKSIAGVTGDEDQAIRDLNPNKFEKYSNLLYYRDKNGDLYYNDFSYVDPYDVVKRPLRTAIFEYLEGEKTDERLKDVIGKAAYEAGREYFRPFLGEAIITETLFDSLFRNGRTKEGYKVDGWKDGDSPETVINNLFVTTREILKDFIPGGAAQIPKLYKAATGDQNEYLDFISGVPAGEKEYDLAPQVIANLTGIRFAKFDPERSLERKAAEYNRLSRTIASEFKSSAIGGTKNGEDFLKAYERANKEKYYAYKDLKLAFDAADILGVDPKTRVRILKNTNVPEEIRKGMKYNRFRPFTPSEQNFKEFTEKNKHYDMSPQTVRFLIGQYTLTYQGMPIINLDLDDNEILKEKFDALRDIQPVKDLKTRERKATGGLVEGPKVLTTEENPADRTNPFTGVSYSGKTSIDKQMDDLFEERLGLQTGGVVSESMTDKPSKENRSESAQEYKKDNLVTQLSKEFMSDVDQRAFEVDVAEKVNRLVFDGELPENYKLKITGKPDGIRYVEGTNEAFNALKHYELGIKYGDSLPKTIAISGREVLQIMQGTNIADSVTDIKNNITGYRLYNRAEQDKERASELAIEELIKQFK
jgi:hypothetical protein